MLVDPRLFFISPNWARHLTRINSITALKKKYIPINLMQNKMELKEFACCVVGESYGFDDNYTATRNFMSPNEKYCEKCTNIAKQFTVYNNEKSSVAIPRLEALIIQFCNHVEKDHKVQLQ